MAIRSLQEIISLENELSAAEEAEQEKAARWLEKQEAVILHRYEEDIAALEEEKKAARERAAEEAGKQAASLLQTAQQRAGSLDSLADSVLLLHLQGIRKFISGQGL